MVTPVKRLSENAYPSMEVTLGGMVTAPGFPAGHWSKTVRSLLYKTPSTALYFGLPEATVMDVSSRLLAKAPSPMKSTLVGMVTPVSRFSANACPSMRVTLVGMVTPVSWLLENAYHPMEVTLFGMVTLVNWLL
jgi:hypothetical protein